MADGESDFGGTGGGVFDSSSDSESVSTTGDDDDGCQTAITVENVAEDDSNSVDGNSMDKSDDAKPNEDAPPLINSSNSKASNATSLIVDEPSERPSVQDPTPSSFQDDEESQHSEEEQEPVPSPTFTNSFHSESLVEDGAADIRQSGNGNEEENDTATANNDQNAETGDWTGAAVDEFRRSMHVLPSHITTPNTTPLDGMSKLATAMAVSTHYGHAINRRLASSNAQSSSSAEFATSQTTSSSVDGVVEAAAIVSDSRRIITRSAGKAGASQMDPLSSGAEGSGAAGRRTTTRSAHIKQGASQMDPLSSGAEGSGAAGFASTGRRTTTRSAQIKPGASQMDPLSSGAEGSGAAGRRTTTRSAQIKPGASQMDPLSSGAEGSGAAGFASTGRRTTTRSAQIKPETNRKRMRQSTSQESDVQGNDEEEEEHWAEAEEYRRLRKEFDSDEPPQTEEEKIKVRNPPKGCKQEKLMTVQNKYMVDNGIAPFLKRLPMPKGTGPQETGCWLALCGEPNLCPEVLEKAKQVGLKKFESMMAKPDLKPNGNPIIYQSVFTETHRDSLDRQNSKYEMSKSMNALSYAIRRCSFEMEHFLLATCVVGSRWIYDTNDIPVKMLENHYFVLANQNQLYRYTYYKAWQMLSHLAPMLEHEKCVVITNALRLLHHSNTKSRKRYGEVGLFGYSDEIMAQFADILK